MTNSVAESRQSDRRETSAFELFCDLIFAATFGTLATTLTHHMSWSRLTTVVVLFVPVFWLWVVYTFWADRYDDDRSSSRLVVLTGMAAVAGLGATMPHVPGDGDGAFVGFYLVARLVPGVLYLRARRGGASQAGRIARNYLIGSSIAACGWIVSTTALTHDARYLGWTLAVIIELGLPFAARRTVASAGRAVDHLTERYSLLAIIVIGEIIAESADAAARTHWSGSTVTISAATFISAAALWWTYFNRGDHEPIGHDFVKLQVFSLGHLPATAALVVIGPAADVLLQPSVGRERVVATTCFAGGISVYLAATAAVRSVFTGVKELIVRTRSMAALIAATLAFLSGFANPLVIVVLASTVLMVDVAVEQVGLA